MLEDAIRDVHLYVCFMSAILIWDEHDRPPMRPSKSVHRQNKEKCDEAIRKKIVFMA